MEEDWVLVPKDTNGSNYSANSNSNTGQPSNRRPLRRTPTRERTRDKLKRWVKQKFSGRKSQENIQTNRTSRIPAEHESVVLSRALRKSIERTPLNVMLTGSNGVGKAFLLNVLLESTCTVSQLRATTSAPGKMQSTYYNNANRNNNSSSQSEDRSKIIYPDGSFYATIRKRDEENATNIIASYIRKMNDNVILDDKRGFLIPQGEKNAPTITFGYGDVPELFVTYPTDTLLRTQLFALHKVEQGQLDCSFYEYRYLKDSYEQVLGVSRSTIPPQYTHSPDKLPVPKNLQEKLGKTFHYRGFGIDINCDRIFIREKLAEVFNTVGSYAIDMRVNFPASVLEGQINISLSSVKNIYTADRARLLQSVQQSDLVLLCFDSRLLTDEMQLLLKNSSFLQQLLRKEKQLILLEMCESKQRVEGQASGLSGITQSHMATLLRNMLSSTDTETMRANEIDKIFNELKFLAMRPLLFSSLKNNPPNVYRHMFRHQTPQQLKAATQVPSLIYNIQNAVLSQCATNIKKNNVITLRSSSPSVKNREARHSLATNLPTKPKKINAHKRNKSVNILTGEFKEQVSRYKEELKDTARTGIQLEQHKRKMLTSSQEESAETYWQNIVNEKVPNKVHEVITATTNFISECNEVSKGDSPEQVSKCKELVKIVKEFNDDNASFLTDVKQLTVAKANRRMNNDGDYMVYTDELPTSAIKEERYSLQLKEKLIGLLQRVVIQMEKLENTLDNVTITEMSVDVDSSKKEEDSFEEQAYNSQKQYKITRKEPTKSLENCEHAIFDSQSGHMIFSAKPWSFNFGHQAASLYTRYQEQLEKENIVPQETASGADSQFRAFAYQAYDTQEAHGIVRLLVMDEILKNQSLYQKFIKIDVQEYICKMAKTNCNGDHVTLYAMCNLYGVDLLIYSPLFQKPLLIKAAKQHTPLVYYIAYVGDNKYQALGPKGVPLTNSSKLEENEEINTNVNRNLNTPSTFKSNNVAIRPEEEDVIDSMMALSSSPSSRSPDIARRGTKRRADEVLEMDNTDSSTTFGKRSKESPPKRVKKTAFDSPAVAIPTLQHFCVNTVVKYSNFIPDIEEDCIPQELIQKIITELIKHNKLTDLVLQKLLNPSITVLKLTNHKKLSDTSCQIIAKQAPFLTKLIVKNCTSITSNGVAAIAKGCPNLVFINLKLCANVDDSGILELASHCKNLVDINLGGCVKVTNRGIEQLSTSCSNLRSLTLKKCNQITDPVFELLGCKLQQLDLSECNQITDKAVSHIADRTQEDLQSLKLSGKGITDKGLNKVAQCSKLRNLEITGSDNVSDSAIQLLARMLPELSALNLEGCKNITPAAFQVYSSNPTAEMRNKLLKLHRLDLTRCSNVTDQALKYIAEYCPQLISLNLTACSDITDKGLIYISKYCFCLEELQLAQCTKITDEAIEHIAQNCKGLTLLGLNGCSNITDKTILALLKHCFQLKKLNLKACDSITDKSIQLISRSFINLEHLVLEELSALTDKSFISIAAGCHKLKKLKLAYCSKITNNGLIRLAHGCMNLTTIDLSFCNNITLDVLQQSVKLLPNLQILTLKGSSYISNQFIKHDNVCDLNLAWSKNVNDAAIISIANNCPRLKTLDLAWCSKVTGRAIGRLMAGCPQLHTLNLRGCKTISPVIVKMLRSTGRMVYQ